MTTLAHEIVTGEFLEHTDDEVNSIMNLVREILTPSNAKSVLEIAERSAERFVFDCSPSEVVLGQIEDGAMDHLTSIRFARPICARMWMEWPANRHGHYDDTLSVVGVLVVDMTKERTLATRAEQKLFEVLDQLGTEGRMFYIYVARTTETLCAPFLVMSSPALPRHSIKEDKENGVIDMGIYIHWSYAETKRYKKYTGSKHFTAKEEERRQKSFMFLMCEAVDALFLLSVPRVCEIEYVRVPRHERRRAERTGRRPELEYRKVNLMLGHHVRRVNSTSHAATPEDDIQHRRLHRVIGHFRTYTKDRPEPHISFIPEHWRGDATLGVVMHERHVHSEDTE